LRVVEKRSGRKRVSLQPGTAKERVYGGTGIQMKKKAQKEKEVKEKVRRR